MAKSSGETPLMQQHASIKAKYPDAILLFRVGDFYETFGQDAIHASRVLGITLTKRNNGNAASQELAGFPHHALETYLHKLVKAGFRVAVCDQLEDPKSVKGIVKRGVTELVTPGVAVNDKLLEQNKNNFLASIHWQDKQLGVAFLDISTGEFFIATGNEEYADKLLQHMQPAEVIFQRQKTQTFKETFGQSFFTYGLDEWIFTEAYATEKLLKQFGTHSLKGFGIEEMTTGIIAAGAVLHYLKETEHPHLQHITSIQPINKDSHLWMDRFTIRNLELISNNDDKYTLFNTLNKTVSPMGARLLRRWMLMPLNNLDDIHARLNAVEELMQQEEQMERLLTPIQQAGDVERLAAKIPLRRINPREVLQVAKGFEQAGAIRQITQQFSQRLLQQIGSTLHTCESMSRKIIEMIVDNPPAALNKGGVINHGVHRELDELRKISTGGKNYLIELQQKEAQQTGISSLKISYNNVFGYYLEVTNVHKSKVPDTWIRKQTLANAERYITPELKTYEEKILGAEDKILHIENELYQQLLTELQEYIVQMQQNAQAMASMDVLCCFAALAKHSNYCKPQLEDNGILDLKNARHPVIEKHLPTGETYIANDLKLDADQQQIIILTGPNMSGKSAILRQTAIITLMAHMGSFVPASAAHIPLTDKIFTRVGASDNLSSGESTFMVEMNETASIINNLSTRSLVLLDEIGRGTSTYDGISIAWSIAEYLHHSPCKPKTLFATHYHELNELENRFEGIKNYHITNKEIGNKVIFLRKLAPGGSTHSFGIHVARMAGMPPQLIHRANEIMEELEKSRDSKGDIHASKTDLSKISGAKMQLNIFDAHSVTFDEIRSLLEHIDINRLTPVEALLKLQEIKQKLN
jgi:DNA mismatch repair protein MutS